MGAHVAQDKSIAVGPGARGAQRAGCTASAADIVDDELLAEMAREDFGNDTADHVSGPARRERYDQRGGVEGIRLRLYADARQHGDHERSHQAVHGLSP
jgi:hypothetical protein